jgi:hypothetical protein
VRQSPWGPGKAPGNDSGRIPGSPCDILGQAACGGGFGVQRRSLPIRAGEPLEAANLETRPHVPQSRYEAGDRSGKGAAAIGADGDVGGIVVEIETANLRAGLEIPENQVPQGVVGNPLRACQCRAAVRADGRGPDVGHEPLEAADISRPAAKSHRIRLVFTESRLTSSARTIADCSTSSRGFFSTA